MIKNVIYEKEADENNYLYFIFSDNNYCNVHFHKNIEILFVKEGRHRVIINGVEHILTAGEIAFSNSYDVHCYKYEEHSKVYIIVIGNNYSSRFINQYGKIFDNFLPVHNEGTKEIFELLDKFYYQKNDNNLLMNYGFIDLLLGLMAKYYPLKDGIKNNNNIIIEILTYINENYKSDITLNSVSERFGYTKPYFSMLFNKYTNTHLRDYINRLRVDRVKELLEDKQYNNDTITAIAMGCGFESLNTFYRAMKKFK